MALSIVHFIPRVLSLPGLSTTLCYLSSDPHSLSLPSLPPFLLPFYWLFLSFSFKYGSFLKTSTIFLHQDHLQMHPIFPWIHHGILYPFMTCTFISSPERPIELQFSWADHQHHGKWCSSSKSDTFCLWHLFSPTYKLIFEVFLDSYLKRVHLLSSLTQQPSGASLSVSTTRAQG